MVSAAKLPSGRRPRTRAAFHQVQSEPRGCEHSENAGHCKRCEMIRTSQGSRQLRRHIAGGVPRVRHDSAGETHRTRRAEKRGKLTFHGAERTANRANVKRALGARLF